MARSANTSTRRNARVRCAIYTRKSSEEGLEQEFNSLQAQREACEAFINSQRHEGWVCLRASYDDGGFSGATMDRPALQQLLADITAGRVDTCTHSTTASVEVFSPQGWNPGPNISSSTGSVAMRASGGMAKPTDS